MDLLGVGLVHINGWLLLVLIFTVLYYYYRNKFQYFTKMGIKGPKPYPVIGTTLPLFTKSLAAADTELTEEYGNVVGTYEGASPVLLIKDKEIIKQILIKESHNFINRRNLTCGVKYIDLMLALLQNNEWKRMRSIVSPIFSTGKLRLMADQINECARLFVANLADAGSEQYEFKSYTRCFTLDVIARTAFGLQVDSQKEKDNLFVRAATRGFDSKTRDISLMLAFFVPFLRPIMGKIGLTQLFPKDAVDFFGKISDDIMMKREESNELHRTDAMQLLLNAHKEKTNEEDKEHDKDFHSLEGTNVEKRSLTKDEIIAQCVMFFLAGYETTANALAFLIYELAINQDHQETLYKEISEIDTTKNVDYNQLIELKFLDMCCYEILRMYPVGARLERTCGKTTMINGVVIKEGQLVAIAAYAIHHDPSIYPQPKTFNPYRWTAEEKSKRSSVDWLTFGAGPRNCVATRLALTEIKIAAVHLVKNYRFLKCEKTEVPIRLKKTNMITPENGFWIKHKKRQ